MIFSPLRLLFALALIGCADSGSTRDPGAPPTEIHDFLTSSPLRDSVLLSGQDSIPIVRFSGIFSTPDGQLAMADVSEGRVSFYDSTGTLLRVVGRKGRGPGEFSEPRFVTWNDREQLIVAEGTGRVSVFSASGTYERSFQVEALGISSLSALSGGQYLVTTYDNPTGILLRIDSTGAVDRRFVQRRYPPAVDRPTHPLWKTVTQYWHVARGDTAYVFATISDSMWAVDLNSGNVTAHHLEVPGYSFAEIPDRMETDRAKMFAWIENHPMAQGAWIDADGTLGVSYVRGTLAYGDSSVLMVRRRDGAWSAMRSAAPIYGTTQSSLLGILHPGSAIATLGLWEKPW